MKQGEVFKAAKRFEERKKAAGMHSSEAQTVDAMRVLISGHDLDLDEILELVERVVLSARRSGEAGIPVETLLAGTWLDGIVTGLMLAEERAKQ